MASSPFPRKEKKLKQQKSENTYKHFKKIAFVEQDVKRSIPVRHSGVYEYHRFNVIGRCIDTVTPKL